ncbi:pantothenate permease [Plesiocystis pacifica SIR-1]|uniref:Pantothenate permease n=1 Tax=Plesiocystis pacifica SIR-1 TaxID=391625 RepID=A6FZR9_9BACT|nr:sodium:solute symporter family protein [Plesiocystis pacifica]EDM80875.1 pantothenate permease [Plesiocystis pacifica SIR-1]
MKPLALTVVVAYMVLTVVLGVLAGRRGSGDSDDFVAGERAFGPVVMYFVVGATIFSAYALLGTPQRVAAKGSDAFYVLSYGAVGLVPLFFFGARVRRIGAREGFMTQAEFVGGRYDSRRITVLMGAGSILSFVPYLVIQLKGAGLVMHAVTGWPPIWGAALVYVAVLTYVLFGGVRGVGWTNVVQGVAMLIVVWTLGLWIPTALYGSVPAMFDKVVEQAPEYLTLPGPGAQTSPARYSSEILVSMLGFAMWPHVFMKCFTARSARLVQQSVVWYPTFLFFLVPLIFLGYVAVLDGGPTDDSVLLWLVDRLSGHPLHPWMFAFVAFAVLAASMSTGDALLHAGGSMAVRDVLMPLRPSSQGELDGHQQTRIIRVFVVALAVLSWVVFAAGGGLSIVDLLLLAFAIPIQFLPLVLLGLYWRRANALGAELGIVAGYGTVLACFALRSLAPELYANLNPLGLEIGVIGLAVNVAVMIAGSLLGAPPSAETLARYELD